MDEETISKYNFSDTGIVVTSERLLVKSGEKEKSLSLNLINSFYVYPQRGFLSKSFVVFANVQDSGDVEVVELEEKGSAVSLKNDLNNILEK